MIQVALFVRERRGNGRVLGHCFEPPVKRLELFLICGHREGGPAVVLENKEAKTVGKSHNVHHGQLVSGEERANGLDENLRREAKSSWNDALRSEVPRFTRMS
eukprot:CAMPEP_0118987698 /NCGR_PEP_ID=MMETSP1173-20130426/44722_1 /TAXON_ID=1034831 /ORGANISM="Rhizochromulina marina cf, Strain CCMP1243" /LENGTH=102 /DNA_ID=CAMNT_0006938565 /DNA_START=113 /DNA_END=425 /DNA_ORIENTATION=+